MQYNNNNELYVYTDMTIRDTTPFSIVNSDSAWLEDEHDI